MELTLSGRRGQQHHLNLLTNRPRTIRLRLIRRTELEIKPEGLCPVRFHVLA